MKIGIYGGSFNPFHYGHYQVAMKALEELDRLIVVPAHISPFKTEQGGAENPVFPPRLEMIRAIFANEPRVVVDDREIRRGGVSYTIDTVRELKAENVGAELFFLVGEDSLARLNEWREIDALKKLVSFKVYPRTKESSTEIRTLFEENHVVRNPDEKVASVVAEGVRRKNGFCPCRLAKRPEFFCPCDEFKAQLRDKAYHGLCHCRLYLKPERGE